MDNKAFIRDFYKTIFDGRGNASDYFSADYFVDYSGELKSTGIDAFYERYALFFATDGAATEVVCIASEGDKVAAYIKMRKDGVTFCRSADIFVIKDGKIASQSSTIMPVRR